MAERASLPGGHAAVLIADGRREAGRAGAPGLQGLQVAPGPLQQASLGRSRKAARSNEQQGRRWRPREGHGQSARGTATALAPRPEMGGHLRARLDRPELSGVRDLLADPEGKAL